jgi:hypothetical protein
MQRALSQVAHNDRLMEALRHADIAVAIGATRGVQQNMRHGEIAEALTEQREQRRRAAGQ